MKTIQFTTNLPYYIISCHSDRRVTSIIMTSITKAEEELLDIQRYIDIVRGNMKFNITLDSTHYYGNIDFSNNSEDMRIIAGANWFKTLPQGKVIPANYDYKTHSAETDINCYRWYETFKPELIAQYAHAVIGKPKRTIIFTHNWKYNE